MSLWPQYPPVFKSSRHAVPAQLEIGIKPSVKAKGKAVQGVYNLDSHAIYELKRITKLPELSRFEGPVNYSPQIPIQVTTHDPFHGNLPPQVSTHFPATYNDEAHDPFKGTLSEGDESLQATLEEIENMATYNSSRQSPDDTAYEIHLPDDVEVKPNKALTHVIEINGEKPSDDYEVRFENDPVVSKIDTTRLEITRSGEIVRKNSNKNAPTGASI